MSSSVGGYTDLTPTGGLLQNNSKPLRFTLLDSNDAGVTGQKANITLYIVEPSGSITVEGSSLTDKGGGSYEYTHEFNEAGWNRWDFYYENGDDKIRVGGRLFVNTRATAAAQT